MFKKCHNSVPLLSFMLALALLFLFPLCVQAQTPWPDRTGGTQPSLLKGEAAPPISDWNPGLNNLSGDVAILFQADGKGGFAPGVGLDIVDYKQGLFTLRAEAFIQGTSVGADESRNVMGVSVMCNLIRAIGLVPGTSWLAKSINPSLGLFVGYDFISGKPTFGPMLSIINIQF